MPVTIFTQDLRGTCIEPSGLIPMGLVFVSGSSDNRMGAVEHVIKRFEEKYPNLQIVVNTTFTFYPSRECFLVEVYGDGYASAAKALPRG